MVKTVKLVSQTFASWNQIVPLLRRIHQLQLAAEKHPSATFPKRPQPGIRGRLCRFRRAFCSLLHQERGDAGRAARLGHVERGEPVAGDDVRVRAVLEEKSDELLSARFVVRVQPIDIFLIPSHAAQCSGVHCGTSH